MICDILKIGCLFSIVPVGIVILNVIYKAVEEKQSIFSEGRLKIEPYPMIILFFLFGVLLGRIIYL